MSFEPGGRAEKYGDEYENRYLAKLLLRLVRETLATVVVEAVGEHSDSVEFVAERNDGVLEYIQCKASNGTKEKWSVSDLKGHDVFQRAKKILLDNSNIRYVFVSPLSYCEIDELCKRARTTPSAETLVQYQLTNNNIRKAYKECVEAFGINANDAQEMTVFVSLLSRCYFERCADGPESAQELEDLISLMFTGNPVEVRILLSQYANALGRYGIPITAKDIVDYLEDKGIHSRSIRFDERSLPVINNLNMGYLASFPAINGQLIPRRQTQEVMSILHDGGCVIVHGKAGNGKSGCLQEVINRLESEHTLYLAIKLDKLSPEISADEFGKKLGLQESPVFCLARLANGTHCVLVLDQLDSLRWTCNHSVTALDVCKEMIRQADAWNQYQEGNISIVFAARTFDLENDRGLKSLFGAGEKESCLNWQRIRVGAFNEDEVIQVVGDTYHALTPRLQHLLLTPASLYVWTQLEQHDRKNSISSVYQLMSSWWDQLLSVAAEKGVSKTELRACKDILTERMENNSTFSLPLAIFSDYSDAIAFLASSGMLKTDDKAVSFVHQSIFDYFITADSIRRIYEGTTLKDIVAPYDAQIPQLRYRLAAILQCLIDVDQTMFIKQSRSLLESDKVRFYFQCTVFEVLGQCENPSVEMLSFLDEYMASVNWRSYILKTVYFEHPTFVKHLQENNHSIADEVVFQLLHSISSKAPDFVVEVLSKYDISSLDIARIAFRTICYDAAKDSDAMFRYRLHLVKMHPCLLDNYWIFPRLFSHNPLRAVQLLNVILESSTQYQYQHVYLGNEKEIHAFAANSCEIIINELVPTIAKQTRNYILSWPIHRCFPNDYSDWADSFHDSTIRKIVEIVKQAIVELSDKCPAEACSLITEYSGACSAVLHELVMHAVSNLPNSYSDYAVQWLLDDFEGRVFVFTGKNDYLFYTKLLLRKFTPSCSCDRFLQLEKKIYRWNDCPERMREIYQHRISINKKCTYYPVYYAFWGHMQKELLPCLDANRISGYSCQLIAVLDRNSWVKTDYFSSGITFGEAKTVISPIEKKAERIGDKRWLKIISTPAAKMNDHWHASEDDTSFVEANHDTFSTTLSRRAKRETKRFALLSLRFPADCYPGYITGVLAAIEEENNKDEIIEFDLLCQVIRRFFQNKDSELTAWIARTIGRRAEEIWPKDIITWLKETAVTHPDPLFDSNHVTSFDDSEHQMVSSLRNNAINCARGCAIHTISKLLWEHKELSEQFKEVVSAACGDRHPAVRLEAMTCLLPYYNYDASYAISELHRLIETDLRTIGTHEFWNLLRADYLNNPQFYRDKLIEACKSTVEDLSRYAVGQLCAVAIFFQDDEACCAIKTLPLSTKQQDEVCKQAITSFKMPEYYGRSVQILYWFIDKATETLPSFGTLFFEKAISIQRDGEFIEHLMKSLQGPALLWQFVNYLDETEEDILCYARILRTIGETLKTAQNNGSLSYDLQSYIRCVVRLSDRGKGDHFVQAICLDIWDNLFQSNIQPAQSLPDMLDNYD